MKKIQYLLVLTALMTTLFSKSYSQEYYESSPAYCDCEQACCMSAYVPIAALVAIGAIILLTDRDHHHHDSTCCVSHSHAHTGLPL